jgi:hypothetical protein
VPVDALLRIKYKAFKDKLDWHKNEKEYCFYAEDSVRLFFVSVYKEKIRMSCSLYLFGQIILRIRFYLHFCRGSFDDAP